MVWSIPNAITCGRKHVLARPANLTRWPLGHRRRSAAHQNDGYNFIRTETDFQSSVQKWSLAVWVCSSRADCIWHGKNLRPSFPAACSSWDKYWGDLKPEVFSLFKFFYLKIKIIGPRGLPRRVRSLRGQGVRRVMDWRHLVQVVHSVSGGRSSSSIC